MLRLFADNLLPVLLVAGAGWLLAFLVMAAGALLGPFALWWSARGAAQTKDA